MNVITSFLVNKRTSLSWAENTLTWSLLLSPWETAPSRKPYQPSPVSREIWVFPLLRYMKDKSRASFLHSFVRIAFLFVLLLSLTDAIRVFRDVISVCRDFSNEVSPPTPNPASPPPPIIVFPEHNSSVWFSVFVLVMVRGHRGKQVPLKIHHRNWRYNCTAHCRINRCIEMQLWFFLFFFFI